MEENKTFLVPNIGCSGCVQTVESTVGQIEGVRSVKADETTKQVTVQWASPATWSQIEQSLAAVDYAPAQEA